MREIENFMNIFVNQCYCPIFVNKTRNLQKIFSQIAWNISRYTVQIAFNVESNFKMQVKQIVEHKMAVSKET